MCSRGGIDEVIDIGEVVIIDIGTRCEAKVFTAVPSDAFVNISPTSLRSERAGYQDGGVSGDSGGGVELGGSRVSDAAAGGRNVKRYCG